VPNPFFFIVGVLIGVAVGRWWALVPPVLLGAWIGFTADTELPSWWEGLGVALGGALGAALGVYVRKRLSAPGRV
jgi:hypothetical protein